MGWAEDSADLGEDFGGARVVIGEGEKQATAMLRVHGNHAQHAPREAMHRAASQVNAVVREPAVHIDVHFPGAGIAS